MFILIWTTNFTRTSRKFIQRHPNLKKKFTDTINSLEHDPFQPSLRLHPLTGKLKGLHAICLTYGYRITLTLKVTEKEIILLDVGSHDEVYE